MTKFLTLARRLALCAGLLVGPVAAQPLFDAHLHYGAADARHFSPEQIVAILDRNDIRGALVSGTPTSATERLYRAAPDRIVPFLSLYRTGADKPDWHLDMGLPARVEQSLASGIYRGIGEFHLFAEHRRSPVFQRVVEIADRHGLMLQVHGDPAVVDAVYEYAPGIAVIWAHAGTYPYPDLMEDYMGRYPTLYVDLSVRDDRIAPNGVLDPAWRAAFLEYPDRFMVGVDTFSTNRWKQFDQVVAQIRHWLGQLPDEVSRKLAHDNAANLLGAKRD